MPQNKIGNPPLFLFFWILSSTITFSFIGAMFHYPSGFGTDLLRIDYAAAITGAILGAISGLIVGVPQWFILRRYVKPIALWILAYVLGIALRHAMGDGSPYNMNLALLPIAGITVTILIQSYSLRYAVKNPYLWLLIAALSYLIGNWLAFVAIDATGWHRQAWTPSLGAMKYALVAGIEGAIVALGTGVGLLWQMKGKEEVNP